MRRISFALLTTASLLALGSGASAADLAYRGVRASPPAPPPACAWFGGFYVGANVGWGYYDHRFNDRDRLGGFIDDDLPGSISVTRSRVNGGVQGGYNWQRGCTVFGIEADWSWTNIDATETVVDGDPGTQDAVTVSSRLRSFGTVRARTGLVVNDVLLYVTGGLAAARFNRTWTFFEDGPATTGVFTQDRTRWGWTGGVGTEWAFAPNWSLKSEFLYMRFEQDTATVTGNGIIGVAGRSYRFDSHDSVWVTRIGVNYRFGGGPVYAAY